MWQNNRNLNGFMQRGFLFSIFVRPFSNFTTLFKNAIRDIIRVAVNNFLWGRNMFFKILILFGFCKKKIKLNSRIFFFNKIYQSSIFNNSKEV